MFNERRNGGSASWQATAPACRRCGSQRRLVVGDGVVVCWPCAFAWGSFAALVTAGPTAFEPVMVDTCRIGHHRPRQDCAWCLGRMGADRVGLGSSDARRGRGA
jgi:hypothetical protein